MKGGEEKRRVSWLSLSLSLVSLRPSVIFTPRRRSITRGLERVLDPHTREIFKLRTFLWSKRLSLNPIRHTSRDIYHSLSLFLSVSHACETVITNEKVKDFQCFNVKWVFVTTSLIFTKMTCLSITMIIRKDSTDRSDVFVVCVSGIGTRRATSAYKNPGPRERPSARPTRTSSAPKDQAPWLFRAWRWVFFSNSTREIEQASHENIYISLSNYRKVPIFFFFFVFFFLRPISCKSDYAISILFFFFFND